MAKEPGRILVISRSVLDQHPYHRAPTDAAWAGCDLRAWLNDTFYNTAFDEKEKQRILPSVVTTPSDPASGTGGESTTTDRLFLLSADKADRCFPSDSARQVTATPYARSRLAAVWKENGMSRWWLRSPGHQSTYAAFVNYLGEISVYGHKIRSRRGGIRPAMWIRSE